MTNTDQEKEYIREHSIAQYTDGSLVFPGDKIRTHQAPGGLLSPGDWRYGVAEFLPDARRQSMRESNAKFPDAYLEPDELFCAYIAQDGSKRYQYIYGHVTEKVLDEG